MIHTSMALSKIVLGLLLVTHSVRGSTNIEIHIDIETPEDYFGVDCNSAKQAKFKKMIDRSVNNKFLKYYDALATVYNIDDPGEACYYSEGEEDDHRRELRGFDPTNIGWVYQSTFRCPFCNPGTNKCCSGRWFGQNTLQASFVICSKQTNPPLSAPTFCLR